MKKIIFTILMFLSLFGCVEVNNTIIFDSVYKGSMSYNVKFNKEIFNKDTIEKLISDIENDKDLGISHEEIKNENPEIIEYNINVKFDGVDNLNNIFSKIAPVLDIDTKVTITENDDKTVTVDLGQTNIISYIIKVNGKILNASSIGVISEDGKQVEFKTKFNPMSTSRDDVSFTYKPNSSLNVLPYILGMVAVIIIGGMVYLIFIIFKKKNNNEDDIKNEEI